LSFTSCDSIAYNEQLDRLLILSANKVNLFKTDGSFLKCLETLSPKSVMISFDGDIFILDNCKIKAYNSDGEAVPLRFDAKECSGLTSDESGQIATIDSGHKIPQVAMYQLIWNKKGVRQNNFPIYTEETLDPRSKCTMIRNVQDFFIIFEEGLNTILKFTTKGKFLKKISLSDQNPNWTLSNFCGLASDSAKEHHLIMVSKTEGQEHLVRPKVIVFDRFFVKMTEVYLPPDIGSISFTDLAMTSKRELIMFTSKGPLKLKFSDDQKLVPVLSRVEP